MNDFPYYNNNEGIIYLDSASTTLRHSAVIKSVTDYCNDYNINLGRTFGSKASEFGNQVEQIRIEFAKLYNCPNFFFTSSATDSLNQIAQILVNNNMINGNSKIVLGIDNHHAAILPFTNLTSNINYIKLDENLNLNVNSLLDLGYEPDIIVLNMSSNVVGYYLQTDEIKDIRKKFPSSIIILDGTQYLASRSIDFVDLGVDFVVGSFHKMYGPTGWGFCMYNKKYQNLKPAKLGGGIVEDVMTEGVVFLDKGQQFESGTLNLDSVLSLAEILSFLKHEVYNHKFPNLQSLVQLKNYNFFISNRSDKTISFCHKIHSNFDLANFLSLNGIIVRVGMHCANPLLHYLNQENGLVRVSLGIYSTDTDINKLIEVLERFEK